MAPTEEWRPIPGFRGYFISDRGRVMSTRRNTPHFMSPRTRDTGHLTVGLRRNPTDVQPTTKLIHQLVLLAFVGPRPDGLQVRHLNGNPDDNRLENLRYGTASENQLDRVRHGRHLYAHRSHCNYGHEFTPENTGRRANGTRRCRTCLRASGRRSYERRMLRAAGIEVAA